MFRATALAAVAAATVPAGATASIGITSEAFSKPYLRVDASGNAEVGWTVGGRRDSVVVPASGELYHSRLSGPDVSHPTSAVAIPYRRVLRRTRDGRLWALQAWQTAWRGPPELRFSRWRGQPTSITLSLKKTGRSTVLAGRATFHGRPVSGSYRTNGGALISLAAQLDCFACPAAHGRTWFRFNGVKTRSGGTFGSGLKAVWMGTRFRATIVGPNSGTTLAPDAARIVTAP